MGVNHKVVRILFLLAGLRGPPRAGPCPGSEAQMTSPIGAMLKGYTEGGLLPVNMENQVCYP